MRFAFTEDQQLLQQTVHEFLQAECTAERVRGFWATETGRSPELWSQLAEMGVTGLLVPEEFGGLGMNDIDMVLLMEEVGRAGLAEPLISTAAIAAPLIRDLDNAELSRAWLPRIAAGEAIIAVAHTCNAFVSDAHIADLILVRHPQGDEIHGLVRDQCALTAEPANDPARRIFSMDWTPKPLTRIAESGRARRLWADVLSRGALATAAQQLGVTAKLIDLAVAYATERKQFGSPIGSFQAVKHHLANVRVQLEYAQPLVYRAAHSVATRAPARATDVSMAKSAASEAAAAAAKVSLQVHGAIGYTWEQDVHVWMRRAWSLGLAWGSAAWHRERIANAVLDQNAPAESFGYGASIA